VVVPIATASTDKDGVVTSTLLSTTYVCPSAGTYTIGAETTHVTAETVIVYPTPAEYAPGTYTHDEIVATVTKTDFVYFCPLTVKVEPTPAPEPAPAPAPAPAPEPVKVAEAPKVEAPPAAVLYESPKPAPAPEPTTATVEPVKASSAPAPVGQLGVSGDKWALTYTPYTEDKGLCKDAATVQADIALIASKGFTAIRVYSTDCGALETVPAAAEAHGINLILGIFINESGIGGAQTQVDAILAWGKFSMVDLVVVGNEALFGSRASSGDLAGFIGSVKGALRAKGYNGPVTTAEPLNVWQANAGALCGVVDVVGLNIHPFFNSDVEASGAGVFAKGQLEIAAALCPGKDAYNLETGWPTCANRCNGKACAGKAEQAAALKSIMSEIGGKSVMFSFGDDQWKAPGDWGCEQCWGSVQQY
jgi:exo-beta-1,3-glucanase (GH17 family)